MQTDASLQGYRTEVAPAAKCPSRNKGRARDTDDEIRRGQVLPGDILADQSRLTPKMRKLAEFCLGNTHGLHRMRILDVAGLTDNMPSTAVA